MAKKSKTQTPEPAPLAHTTLEQPTAPASAAPATPAPSSAMLALFKPAPGLDIAKLERRNMPRMYKPDEVPVGEAISGEVIRICDSPVSTVKGKLLWLRHHSGEEFTFPCTGVIRNALAPGVDNEKELLAKLNAYVGKTFVALRTPDKTSGKYKKSMFMFDVFTS